MPIVYFKGLHVDLLNQDMFLSLKMVLNLANNADLDEVPHCAAFHPDIHSV